MCAETIKKKIVYDPGYIVILVKEVDELRKWIYDKSGNTQHS